MAALRPRFGHWVIFDHCMPFNVSRAFDEASGHDRPRIWTAERDLEMWQALASQSGADDGRERPVAGRSSAMQSTFAYPHYAPCAADR